MRSTRQTFSTSSFPSQESRNAAIPLDLDDDAVSVQSQDTDKQHDTLSSSLSKSSSNSKESTPQPVDDKKDVKEPSVGKATPEQEKKVRDEIFWTIFKGRLQYQVGSVKRGGNLESFFWNENVLAST